MINKLSMNVSSIPDDEYQQGYCPDVKCNERLVYKKSDEGISCYFCGNRLAIENLRFKSPIEYEEAKRLKSRIENLLRITNRTSAEWSRVNGISQFQCKFISPLFSKYGISQDWVCLPLHDLGFIFGFDEKLIKDRAFFIQRGFGASPGYGADESCVDYLMNTLLAIASFGRDNRLIPLTISKDGISLLQCFSRALVGREIFWHPLGQLLKEHFKMYENFYLENLNEFNITEEEWREVLNEYDKCTNEQSSEQSNENAQIVRIFAFSNILCRPVILLNAIKKNDNNNVDHFHSQTFLPILRSYEDLRKNGKLISPLVVAWSGESSSRIVPLVGIKGFPAPKLPRSFLPKPFLTEKCELDKFIEFDSNDFCVVADGRQVKYLNSMIRFMQKMYLKKHGISPLVVSDYAENVLDSLSKQRDIKDINKASDEKRLYRCLICWSLNVAPEFPEELLENNGFVYQKIKMLSGDLVDNEKYTLKPLGSFYYNQKEDCFDVAALFVHPPCFLCKHNAGQMRLMNATGKVFYLNCDHTRIPALNSKCKRQMKHFFNFCFYDNVPLIVPVDLTVIGRTVESSFAWFDSESEHQNNSNIVDIAQRLIRDYFYSDLVSVETVVQSVTQQCIDALLMTQNSAGCLCRDPFWSFEHDLLLKQISEEENDYSVFLYNFWNNHSLFLETPKKVQIPKKEKPVCIYRADIGCETFSPTSKLFPIVGYSAEPVVNKEIVDLQQVLLSNGEQKYIRFEKRHTYSEIVQKICGIFLIWPRSILCILSPRIGQIHPKSQAVRLKYLVYVQLKEENELVEEFANSFSRLAKVTIQILSNNLRMCSLRLVHELTLGRSIFWYFVENSSEMFVSGGSVYEFVKERCSLVDDWHYALPGVLPNKKLVYNANCDRLELCIWLAHFEINGEIHREMLKRFNLIGNTEAKMGLELEMISKRISAAFDHILRVPAHTSVDLLIERLYI